MFGQNDAEMQLFVNGFLENNQGESKKKYKGKGKGKQLQNIHSSTNYDHPKEDWKAGALIIV